MVSQYIWCGVQQLWELHLVSFGHAAGDNYLPRASFLETTTSCWQIGWCETGSYDRDRTEDVLTTDRIAAMVISATAI
jgi:hypothetical protein